MTKLSLYLVTLLLGTHFPGPAVSPVVQRPSIVAQSRISSDEQRLVDLTNAERRAKGLPELHVNMMLVQVARQHSKEMFDKNYFDHHSPTPGLSTPKDRYLRGLGRVPVWACIGENLFYSSVVDPDLGHKCLMESLPHAQNILNTQFNEIGVGVYESADGKFWVTQMFLTQVS